MNKKSLRISLIFTALLGTSGWTARNASAQLFAVEVDTNNLYTVSTSNAKLSLVGHLAGFFGTPCEIQFSPEGTMYAFSASFTGSANLYRIDPAIPAAYAYTAPLNLAQVGEGGLAFAPDGTAYAANAGPAQIPQLFTINLGTGVASIVGTISGGQRNINGLAYRSDGKLIGLDGFTNSLLVIDPITAAAVQLALVPSTVGAVGGMTVLNGTGYYCTSGPNPVGNGPGSNSLYSFDLFSGASTLIGTFDGTITGTGISGLAAPVPEPSTLTLVTLAGIALFAARPRGRHSPF